MTVIVVSCTRLPNTQGTGGWWVGTWKRVSMVKGQWYLRTDEVLATACGRTERVARDRLLASMPLDQRLRFKRPGDLES